MRFVTMQHLPSGRVLLDAIVVLTGVLIVSSLVWCFFPPIAVPKDSLFEVLFLSLNEQWTSPSHNVRNVRSSALLFALPVTQDSFLIVIVYFSFNFRDLPAQASQLVQRMKNDTVSLRCR